MKLVIFGTGNYYKQYKKYFSKDEILYLVDNDEQKQGTMLDGKIIYEKHQINYSLCDYIIILIKQYKEIRQQLLNMEIPLEKIKSYKDIIDLTQQQIPVISHSKELTLHQWITEHKKNKIIIFSHDFSRSGVPVALMNLALLLKKMNYDVLLGALGNGKLQEELEEHDVDYIADLELIYRDDKFLERMKEFNLAIIGSLVLAELGKTIVNVKIPIMWWLHESNMDYYKKYRLPDEEDQIYYFAVSNRVKRVFNIFYPMKKIDELLYYLPSINENTELKKINKKILFAVIGKINKIKAQDILIQAIELVPENQREKMQVVFVGSDEEKSKLNWEKIQKRIPQISMIGELTQKEIEELYNKIDILVCPSRDDPMPIVVSQAMQYGVPCIISDQVGQSEFIKYRSGIMVFPNEDINELLKLIIWCIENPQKLIEEGENALKIYEMYFTEQYMRRKLNGILKQILEV